MKIYNAHPMTGEYIGEGLADPDLLEGEGHWLIPAHAYLDAPPVAGKNKTVIRDGESWKIVDDFRGTAYYTDGPHKYTIEDLGVTVPKGATSEPPPPTVAELTANALAKRDGLIFTAGLRIAPLQDAADLGDSTEADGVSLKLWKQYRSAVSKTETKPGWPENPQWPDPPVPLETLASS